MFDRWYASRLGAALERPFVHLVFGARQTGKSTLIRSLLPADALVVDLAKRGFIVCRCSRPLQLHDQVTAIPWSCL